MHQADKWYAGHLDQPPVKETPGRREPGPWAPFDRETADRLPRRDKPSDPVRGILDCGDAGRYELRSGHEPVPKELGVPRDTARLVVMQDHVEGHAAVGIRSLGVDHATLYVNKDPCKGRLGCDRALPFMLPEGARLTVYSPDGQPRLYTGWSDRKELPR